MMLIHRAPLLAHLPLSSLPSLFCAATVLYQSLPSADGDKWKMDVSLFLPPQ